MTQNSKFMQKDPGFNSKDRNPKRTIAITYGENISILYNNKKIYL